MIPADPGLSIENLSFSYPAYPGIPARNLFDGLELALPVGSICVLLARPDQGKTTLCRLLAGLIPRFSGGELRGEIRLGSLRPLEIDPYELIEQVGMVFQHPGEQLLASRCDSEVAFALESLGISRPEIKARVAAALNIMDLDRYYSRSPKILSGGEKKKLLIACLLAIDPRLWLLDETLEELDGATKRQLLTLLKEKGRSTLILSAKWHALFREYADRIFLLEGRRIRAVPQRPGTAEFQQRLYNGGFVLPGEGRGAGKTGLTSNTRGSQIQSAAGDRTAMLVAEDLRFSYREDGAEGTDAFRLEIDHLRLDAGRTVSVVGDNGSGKSTLARLLCGLLAPTAGHIRIRKRGALEPAVAEELNRFTGYLFQDPDLQIFLPTVLEELALGLKHLDLPAGEIEKRIEKTLSLFALPAAQTPPSLMSYGSRKKLQAGVYYLLERPLMIIDEGDSGLSIDDFTRMIRIFQKPERALIFITHDHRLARALADEVVELKAGRRA